MVCIISDIVTRQKCTWDKGVRRLLQACPENAVGTCYDTRTGQASLQHLCSAQELTAMGGGGAREIQVAWGMR